MPQTFAYVLAALAGLSAGPLLANVAAFRASRQPVDFDIDAEKLLLSWLFERPGRLVRIPQLEAGHFADAAHGRLFSRLRTQAGPIAQLGEDADEASIVAAEESVEVDLRALADDFNADLMASLLTNPIGSSVTVMTDEEGLRAAQRVYAAGDDRLRYPGHSPIEQVEDSQNPLVRRRRRPSTARMMFTSLLGAAAMTSSVSISDYVWPDGAAHILALSALTLLSVGSIVWALVDHETLLIDLETFFPITIGSWLLAIAADIVGGAGNRAITGFALSIALAVFFRLVNFMYGIFKLRTTGTKVDGMGGGDSWLVLATAGVPAALAGSMSMWYLCAMAGMVAAVVVWLVRWPTPWRIGRTTPFAFGPYLALGWIIGGAIASTGIQIW